MEENIFKPDFSNINIDKSIPTISISGVLDSMEKPFDQEGVAEKTYDNNFNNPKSQYYQKSIQEIIDMWQAKGADSRHYGSLLDDYIGLRLNDKTPEGQIYGELLLWKMDNNFDNDDRLKGLAKSFDDFYSLMSKSGDTIFIDREKTVYYKIEVENPISEGKIEYYVKGRFDALFYNKRTNKWIIIDWKSSGSIDKVPTRYTEKFLGPMCKYPALNYYRYTNQLHFYKKTLLENYLPEGTNPDDVVIMIVNLPGKVIEESGQDYMTHLAGMKYDPILLDQIYTFAIQKKLLEKPEKKQETKEEAIIEQSDNIENLF